MIERQRTAAARQRKVEAVETVAVPCRFGQDRHAPLPLPVVGASHTIAGCAPFTLISIKKISTKKSNRAVKIRTGGSGGAAYLSNPRPFRGRKRASGNDIEWRRA